jgi:glycosyltransferase involved in cell wall biosynthesis
MKIAFISIMEGTTWGGSEELWFRTAKEAYKKGFKVCSLTKEWSEVPDKISELRALNIKTFFFRNTSRSLAQRVFNNLKWTKSNDYVLPDVDADFYILSQGGTYDFLYRPQITKLILDSGKPFIIISQHNSEHGNIIDENVRHFAIDFIKKAKKFCFVSERNRITAERQLASRIDNATTISNPSTLKQVGIKLFNNTEKLMMACVARLDCDFKGQDILLQVLSTPSWREREFCLTLYGSGRHHGYLTNLISYYNLENKVVIQGHVDDVDDIWNHNHVLILPSISEGTSLALIEAMLSGRTALVTDVGDSSVYVEDEKTGFLAESASLNSIGAALEKLWKNKANMEQLGINGYRNALKITNLNPEQTLIDFISE